ncbi:MAG TPA: carbohydrate kinase family protein [Clostridiaceae bacterium]|nr:carbohydrate kinase family protein [Clostridiaceae bacterium]
MGKKYDVVTIGDVCVDIMISGGDVEPEFNQKEKVIGNYVVDMGGSCTIFACQTAKLGLKTVVIGTAGCDIFGKLVIERLKEAGVDTRYIFEREDIKTGIGIALCKDRDRAILTYIGSIDALEFKDVPLEVISQAKHMHIGSYYLMNKIRPHFPELLNFAKQQGVSVSLDTNWDPNEKWTGEIENILQYVDVFFPNENELCAIMQEQNTEKALKKACEIIPLTIVKLGNEGSMFVDGGVIKRVKVIDVDVVDTVGAGDAFDAGFLYGWLNGMPVERCVELGNLCGSLSTTKGGGIQGQLWLHDLKRIFQDVYQKPM